MSKNGFSKRLHKLGFDFFQMIVVDLMHEFELGIWKAVLKHLIRMLYTISEGVVHEMNNRYGYCCFNL